MRFKLPGVMEPVTLEMPVVSGLPQLSLSSETCKGHLAKMERPAEGHHFCKVVPNAAAAAKLLSLVLRGYMWLEQSWRPDLRAMSMGM
eukprot:3613896-Amphidinium_carterae.2